MQRLKDVTGDVSGAFGDLGTLLPYVIAALGLGVLAPTPVFLGFAAGYLLVALLYRLPVAVQPMKALGAVILTGGLTASETAWAGALIGLILLVLAATPRLTQVARALPQSIVTGLQAGLGLMLGAMALSMMAEGWLIALPALAALGLSWVWPRGPWALLVVASTLLLGTPTEPLDPAVPPPDTDLSARAVATGVMAQLPLTLLNAVVVAAAVAHSLYPGRADRVNERRLAASSGLLNLALAPLGAMPMCHGAGGIAAHHRFGARSLVAPLVMAGVCALAALQGPTVIAWLAAIPTPVVGALLAYAAVELMLSKRLFDARPDCRPVIAITAGVTLFGGALLGLIAGLIAEKLRKMLIRRRGAPTGE
ncbi:putative sulfate/molybdate transporter [Aidingimonas halophila]|uniref:Molybdate transporter of MFS superfamily protein n=1 Tax=Aidingimonas halophila TaxID=574349 RepID=A0A1H2UZI3_9GAMM|nr:putative sulfate/molybdate transporter [Aidingimonas halophila]GHC23448.1 sulfate transporter [Aidingimonas halophila]SDW61485.1 Molybdate transporter of MFS superfamily protein [Aidingimonas halophila]